MNSSFKKQLLISFGIIFGAVVAASIALYFLSSDLTAEANKIIFDKTLTARQAVVLSVLADLKRDAKRAAQYKGAMDKLLPAHDDLIGFSQWLNALARAHNISVSFSFRGDNTPATESIPGNDGFSLSSTGLSNDLSAFLKDIETQSPGFLLNVDSFDLVNSAPNYRLSLQGKLFSK